MYKLIAIASTLIRFQYIPNPFETLEYGYLINFIVEPLFHLLTFSVVGLYYTKGSFTAFGSFLYLLFYGIHVGLIMLMSIFNWNIVVIVIISIVYLIIHVFAKFLLEGSFY